MRFSGLTGLLGDIVHQEQTSPFIVQGYIPPNGIDFDSWTCVVRYPNPKQGMEPAQLTDSKNPTTTESSYLEAIGVPCPKPLNGTIGAAHIDGSVINYVTLGLPSHDIGKPFILSIKSYTPQGNATSVDARVAPTSPIGATAAPAQLPQNSGPVPSGGIIRIERRSSDIQTSDVLSIFNILTPSSPAPRMSWRNLSQVPLLQNRSLRIG